MVTNSVPDAKQEVATNLCTIDDVDITEKGVHEVSSIDDNGQVLEHRETYFGEVEGGYYFCQGCGETWSFSYNDNGSEETRQEQWNKVKEHLNA